MSQAQPSNLSCPVSFRQVLLAGRSFATQVKGRRLLAVPSSLRKIPVENITAFSSHASRAGGPIAKRQPTAESRRFGAVGAEMKRESASGAGPNSRQSTSLVPRLRRSVMLETYPRLRP